MDRPIHKFIEATLFDFSFPDELKEPSFRGSALPVCGRLLAFASKTKVVARKTNFKERYNIAIGDAIHDLVQHTWAEQGILWGSWKCVECEYRQHAIRLPPKAICARCGFPMTYEEVALEDVESGFKGKSDGALWVEEVRAYVAVEVKSRNDNLIKSNKDPYLSDFLQVSSYATLLKRHFGLNIIGRLILWIGKPRPQPYKVWYYEGTGEEYFELEKQKKMLADKLLSENRPEEIPGRCKSKYDAKDCKFQTICFSADRVSLTRKFFQDKE